MRAFSVLLLLCWCVCVCAQDAAPRIVKITFSGSDRYGDVFLRSQIASKVGQALDRGLLTRDERILSEYFAAVLDIKEKKVDGGVELIFSVLDNLVAGKVIVTGSRVDREDYEPLLATRLRRPLLEYSLNADKDMLQRLHRERGYPFVSVQIIRTKTDQPKTQDILFQVLADHKVQVVEVIFEGATSLAPAKLLDVMRTPHKKAKRKYYSTLQHVFLTPFKPIGNLLDDSFYQKRLVEEDRQRLERFYREEGFRDARVVLVRTGFNATRDEAVLHFRVTEGPRYAVRSLKVEYAPGGEPKAGDREYLSPEALEALTTLDVGDPYRAEDLRQSQRSISERLFHRGYALTRVQAVVTPADKRPRVDIRFVIAAGEKVRVGEIRFIGNRYTRDNVLRRQFREGALSGRLLDVEALLAGQQRVSQLRYFEYVRFAGGRPWGLIKSLNKDRPDEYDIEIEVKELDTTRQFRIGGAVDTDGGASAQLDITWQNFDISRAPANLFDIFEPGAFRGGGQEFTISLAPGTRNSFFQVQFRDPAVNDSRWSLNVSFFRTLSNSSRDFDLETDGVLISVGRFLDGPRNWRLIAEWSLKQVLLDEPSPDAPVNAIDEQGHTTLNALRLMLIREHRKASDPFLNGHITRLSGQLVGGFLGGDVDIVKVQLGHSWGFPLFETGRGVHRVRLRFSVDWADAFDDTRQVPIYERFFLGGRNLRGFEFREVGPRSNGRPSGGEFLVRFSTEYTVPIVSAEGGVGIDIVLFVDQGGVATTLDDWNSDSWRIGAGFALALSFRLGGRVQPPFMIEFGWPLVSQPGDQSQLISISFSGRF